MNPSYPTILFLFQESDSSEPELPPGWEKHEGKYAFFIELYLYDDLYFYIYVMTFSTISL